MLLTPVALLFGALAPLPPASPARPADSATVTAVATDYHIELPRTLPAGRTSLRVANHGKEAHQVLLVRLLDGKTSADLAAAFKAGGPPPAWAVDAGGPNAVDPGGTSMPATLDLAAGHYVALCLVPSPDGTPHVMKGMMTDLTVTPAVTPASISKASTPRPDVTMTLMDYGFEFSKPITTATRIIRVKNAGSQPHELELVQLAPGKTASDVTNWVEHMQGPPPGHFLGGVAPISRGQSNDLAVHLTPGRYAMICFLPDAKDGRPHFVHGMTHEITVQ